MDEQKKQNPTQRDAEVEVSEDEKSMSSEQVAKETELMKLKKAEADAKKAELKVEESEEDFKKTEDAHKAEIKAAKEAEQEAKRKAAETASKAVVVSATGNITEEYDMDDYELYKLLDNNGFVPSEKNLNDLKEGLENGKYAIFTYGSEMLTEGVSGNDLIGMLLEENGYEDDEYNRNLFLEMKDQNCILFLQEKLHLGTRLDRFKNQVSQFIHGQKMMFHDKLSKKNTTKSEEESKKGNTYMAKVYKDKAEHHKNTADAEDTAATASYAKIGLDNDILKQYSAIESEKKAKKARAKVADAEKKANDAEKDAREKKESATGIKTEVVVNPEVVDPPKKEEKPSDHYSTK